MMTKDIESVTEEIEESGGLYLGQWRRPVNSAIHVVGSIHDDNMASKLGFRGGTVAGSIHFELFPPLMLKAFGQRWFEKGSLSMYFLDPTVDREEVRAVVRAPSAGEKDSQVEVWAERPDGRRIGEGTAAVGEPNVLSALMERDISRYPPGELRILAQASVGDQFSETPVEVTPQTMQSRLSVITDPLAWYEGPSPWGGSIVTPCHMVDMMRAAGDFYLISIQRAAAVPLYGAIEIRNVNGPVFAGRPYRAGGVLASLGQSPKTEYLWYDSYLDDMEGKRIAEMRMMYRFMKASSSLYE